MIYLPKYKKRTEPQVTRADIGYIRELAWVFEQNGEDLFIAWPQDEAPKELAEAFPKDDLDAWAVVVSHYGQDIINTVIAKIPNDKNAQALWELDFRKAKARENTLFEGQVDREELIPKK